MKKLQLSLKEKWFDLTNPDGKTEDYREINEYWMKRLLTEESYNYYLNCKHSGGNEFENGHFNIDYVDFKEFSHNVMTLGYPSKTDISRIKIFEHGGIEIREGNPEWGAEPGKLYFVIKHGKKIQ